jgi:cell division protease FtsH
VASLVDAEVRTLIDDAHDRARAILSTHRGTLDVLAKALVEKETLEDSDLAEIFGPLDKGTGIEVPDPEPIEIPVPVQPELLGATVAEAQPVVQPAAAPAPEVVPAKRRWWKRLGVRAPRPSGT